MRQPEYQRVANEVERLTALKPEPGTPDAQRLEFLRKRLQVHDALTCAHTPAPDTDGLLGVLERTFRR